MGHKDAASYNRLDKRVPEAGLEASQKCQRLQEPNIFLRGILHHCNREDSSSQANKKARQSNASDTSWILGFKNQQAKGRFRAKAE